MLDVAVPDYDQDETTIVAEVILATPADPIIIIQVTGPVTGQATDSESAMDTVPATAVIAADTVTILTTIIADTVTVPGSGLVTVVWFPGAVTII